MIRATRNALLNHTKASRVAATTLRLPARLSLRHVTTPSASAPQKDAGLGHYLAKAIEQQGPMSVAAFMKHCLTNPSGGYYIDKDPLGVKGDFTTSPEISQMFGELVGLWLAAQWLYYGQKQPFRVIEYGPGRGTLMDDSLRALCAAKSTGARDSLKEVLLVEASPVLRDAQRKKLCGDSAVVATEEDGSFTSVTTYGVPIRWYEDAKQLDKLASSEDPLHNYIVAHEFFDALPIYQFEKTDKGWRELMVNYGVEDKTQESSILLPNQTRIRSSDLDKKPETFHLITAPTWTAASKVIPESHKRYRDLPVWSKIEVCPDAWDVANQMGRLVAKGGAAFIVDYAVKEGVPINTLRGIRDHKMCSPFADPGQVDLSADVDFTAIGIAARAKNTAHVSAFGPTDQATWLKNMGIEMRTEKLMEGKDEKIRSRIESQYKRLVDRGVNGMGKIYKAFFLAHSSHGYPVGFPIPEPKDMDKQHQKKDKDEKDSQPKVVEL